MVRLLGPDENSRLVYAVAAGSLRSAAGSTAIIYADENATTLADILTEGGTPVAGSTVTVDANSKIPIFQFPDGVDRLYAVVGGGPVTPIYANTDDRIDSLDDRLTAVEAGGGGGVDDSLLVHKAGVETITGVKTFTAAPVVPTPTGATEAATKSYADGVATTAAAALAAHAAVTTNVHGITSTGTLETTTGAQAKADAAQAAAISASAQRGANLSDLASAATARTNLGLGTAATTNTGTGATNTIVGNDARLTDARTPTAHAASHGSGGGDPVTVAQSQVTGLSTSLSGKQDADADLTAIAALAPADDTVIQRKSGAWTARTPAQLKTDLAITTGDIGAQPADSDLTAVAALAPSNDDLLQRKSGAWTNRTPTQVKTDLVLTKSDVGLGSVDNTADSAKPVSTAQQAALDLKAPLASPTFTGTVSGVNKAMVGLSDVDNTSDAAKPISTATQAALNAKLSAASNLSDVANAGTSRSNLGLGTAAVTDTGTGAGNTILGNDSRLTDARTPTAHATSHGSGGSDPVTLAQSQITNLTSDLAAKLSSASADTTFTRASDPGDILTTGQVVPRRTRLSSAVSQVSGTLVLTYFYADRSETINTLTVWTRNIAAGATPTLCRMGLYSVAGNGDITLIASTPNDTSLFAATDTAYPKAVSTPVALTRGTLYATALLVVTGATAPNFHGWQYLSTSPINTIVRLSPPIVGRVTSQTDLPGSISAGSIVGYQASTAMQLS